MKKVISLIMALVLCLCLCACSDNLTEHGSQFVGKYEHNGDLTEYHSAYGYDNLVRHVSFTEVLTLNGGGTGTFKATATSSGDYWNVGDVIKEGTVQWTCEGDYITITFKGTRYSKDYGNNTSSLIDTTTTYEKKAGTLHTASSGTLIYRKVG